MNSGSNRWVSGPALVFYVAVSKLVVQLAVCRRYAFFHDELYYIDCAQHLSWGYVDHPPLIAFLAWLVRHVGGDSLFALRFLPAIAGAGLVWMAGALARELGGDRIAQFIAAIGVASVPMLLTLHYLFTMNAFEPLFWMGCAYLIVLSLNRKRDEWLIWVGVVAGVGMMNKYSMAIFLIALLLGIVLGPERRILATPQLWLGLAIAAMLWIPNLLWLLSHHFPFFEWQYNVRVLSGDILRRTAVQSLQDQVILAGVPLLFSVWGVGHYLIADSGRRARFLGIAVVLAVAILFMTQAKNYYTMPAYPIAIVGGALAFAQTISTMRFRTAITGGLAMAVIFASAAVAPLFIPILTPRETLEYQNELGISIPPQTKLNLERPLQVFFTGQFGLKALTDQVAVVFSMLPEQQRTSATIFARTFQEAAAINVYGKKYGLPNAISGHLSYWIWGPGEPSQEIVVFLGYPYELVAPMCASSRIAGKVDDPYAYNEITLPITVCYGMRPSIRGNWAKLKMYY